MNKFARNKDRNYTLLGILPFELRKELGYSNAEVAKQLNLSEQTVKNQLSLALKKLRTKLAEHLSLFFICF
jgi:DNA-binding CsgD family transcriptional regulator